MSAWRAIEEAEPGFAGRVRALFEVGRHKTIATLRADGGPRISGIECEFAGGELRFGSMAGAVKGADLKRDTRFALHGPTVHPVPGREAEWPGEAKIAGRAVLRVPAATDLGEGAGGDGATAGGDSDSDSDKPDSDGADSDGAGGDAFVADITEVVITSLSADATRLVIESWTPERGLRRWERD